MTQSLKFYEFFCGGGMARAGLGPKWDCLFSNDFDPKKGTSYLANWGDTAFKLEDIAILKTSDLPNKPDLAWASFPCQDLSLAGMGAGLKGNRSGTFWPFWKIIQDLGAENRSPKMIVLENVCGTLTSHNGKDFSAICKAMRCEGYLCGAVVIDAADFVPQSRPRLFIIGIKDSQINLDSFISNKPDKKWHTDTLIKSHSKLDVKTQAAWVWWKLPYPQDRTLNLIDIIEKTPSSVNWHSDEQTSRLIQLMSSTNLAKLEIAKKQKKLLIGAIYRRTRSDMNGNKNQRAEIRFDDTAGCLRTPSGGSSRQIIMTVKGNKIRSRLLSSREAARLMGLPDSYELPLNYNDAYHLLGDGLVVPVVNHIARFLLEPLLLQSQKIQKAA